MTRRLSFVTAVMLTAAVAIIVLAIAMAAIVTGGFPMSLVGFVVILIALGVLLWLFNTYVTMIDPIIKRIINIVAIVAIVVWVLAVIGVLDNVLSVQVPRV